MKKATTNEVLNFIENNTPTALQLVRWGIACNLTVKELVKIIDDLVSKNKITETKVERDFMIYEVVK